MSLATAVAELEQALEAERAKVRQLRKQLASVTSVEGVDDDGLAPVWADGLTGAQTALIAVLAKHWPRWVQLWALDAAVPAMDHAADRDPKTLDVQIHKIRKKLGRGAVLTQPGRRRLGDELAQRIRGRDAALVILDEVGS